MRRFGIASITLQLTILFVAVLTVSQLVHLGYRYFVQTEALPFLEAVRIADRVAITVALIEDSTGEQRARIADQFKESNLLLALGQDPWNMASIEPDEKVVLLRDLLKAVIPGQAAAGVRVGYAWSGEVRQAHADLSRKWDYLRSHPAQLGRVVAEFANDPTFLISVPLSDGSWLNMTAAYADTLDFWPFDDMALLGIMVIVVAILSIWVIRRLTAPFRLFADAAARLGTDVNAPPIAERGPAEVLGAIHSFNDMQRKLQRFIADRTRMVAAMSHDLRTPITRLRLRGEFIEDPVQRAKAMADLSEMEQMIDGVLAFAKEDMHIEPTSRVDLVAMLQSICDAMADQGHCVSLRARARPILRCRPMSMRRCLTNLIENAVKYGETADVRVRAADGGVEVDIDDHGPGIPDHLREQVFRPFFRVDESRNRDSGGAGLGLSVARDVARAHGGDVVIENRAGSGLRVCVRLPGSDATGGRQIKAPRQRRGEDRLTPRDPSQSWRTGPRKGNAP